MLYRIYTEDIDREMVLARTADHFDSFTVLEATGYWKGQPEKTVIIEILTDKVDKVMLLAEIIREKNSQEAVLVVKLDGSSTMITA